MAGTVEKKILRFGGRARLEPSSGAQDIGGWAGVPGDPEVGGCAVLSGLVTGRSNSLDLVGVDLQTPGRHHADGPIRAISIANDSPLEGCDVYVGSGGQVSRHRINPGAPYIGDISENAFVRIAPSREMPIILGVRPNVIMTVADFRRQVVTWEAPLALTSVATIPAPMIPLKLNVFRGDAQVNAVIRRATYHASLLWEITAGGAAGTDVSPSLVVIVDGRRRFRVIAGQTDAAAAAPSMQIYGLEAWKTSNSGWGAAEVDRDRVSFDELLPVTALTLQAPDSPTIFDYNGNPYFAVVVNITGNNAARGYVQVHAWDE